MAGYEAEIGGVARAGRSMADAGEQAGDVDLPEALSDVGTALPGSRSAQAARRVGDAWRDRVENWSAAATGLGRDTMAAADSYAANEEVASDELASTRGSWTTV